MVLEGDGRRQGGAPGDRRHQPARGGARLDPRRLRDRRSARTWSTAPTRPESAAREIGAVLPRARVGNRSVASARGSSSRPARPSVGRSSQRLGVVLHGAPDGCPGARATGDARAVAAENALRKATRGARSRRGRARARRATPSWRSTAACTASRPTRDAARRTLRALSGRTHEVVSGARARWAASASASRRRTTEVTFRALVGGTRSTGTWPPASGATARAATPSRAPARRSSRAWSATTRTSSACRSRPWRGSVPELLGPEALQAIQWHAGARHCVR